MLVQVANRNLGDSAITDTARYLIEQCLKNRNFQIFDYSITSGDLTALSFADLIIFTGGGIIKFRQEKFDLHIIEILNEAQRLSIPVFFNAVGVEGYDADDERCRNLKSALNLPCVKGISVRDDYTAMRDYYISNPDILVSSVFDPATWSAQVYPRLSQPTFRHVGLGVVREGLFADYGFPEINREFQLDFWRDVVSRLEADGYTWEIFTNGVGDDEIFAQEVLSYIGHGKKALRPAEPAQLVNTICSYEVIIACRMHTNILAHTFSVPSVGLVWNDKLAFWGEKIGHGDRFLRPAQMQPEYVVNKAIQAAAEGCNILTEAQLSKAKDALDVFLKKYSSVRTKNFRHDAYHKKIVADALGGRFLKYKNLNTKEGMDRSIRGGCRWLEVDVRLSRDKKLVCVNGWNKDTYTMLGVDPSRYGKKGMDVQKFRKQRYHGLYPTATFEDIVSRLPRNRLWGNVSLLVDVGRPTEDDFAEMLNQMKELNEKYRIKPARFVIRVQRRGDVQQIKQMQIPWRIAFYLPKDNEKFEDGIFEAEEAADFCENNGISFITMSASSFSRETAHLFHSKKIRCCIMKCAKIGTILNALDEGADFVCSVFADANRLTDMTG